MNLFCGDLHADFQPVIRAVGIHSLQAVILLGDFRLERSLFTLQSVSILNDDSSTRI